MPVVGTYLLFPAWWLFQPVLAIWEVVLQVRCRIILANDIYDDGLSKT